MKKRLPAAFLTELLAIPQLKSVKLKLSCLPRQRRQLCMPENLLLKNGRASTYRRRKEER
jgi:hypothetical protein